MGLAVALAGAVACSSPSDGAQTDAQLSDAIVAQADGGSLDGADAALAPPGKQTSSPRGVYVPTFNSAIVGAGGDKTLQGLVSDPNVDGFFLSRRWQDVEPTKGAYAFDSLVADLRAVAAAGKKATIGIGAGILAPSYLCQSKSTGGAGAQCLALVIHPPQATGQCIDETLPLPWDPVLQERFGAMVTGMAAAIAADSVAEATVVDVKITGFNDRDEETILPGSTGGTIACTSGNACTNGVCDQSDAIAALKAAGYSDATATSAILALAGSFRAAFPDFAIGAQVSPGLPSPGSDNVHVVMDKALVADSRLFPLTAQNQGLSGTESVDDGLVAAAAAGAPIGFQMLAYVANNPTCLMGKGLGPGGGNTPCDQSVLQAAIDNGEGMGAQWLEIYAQDVVAYPSAIAAAHAKLTK